MSNNGWDELPNNILNNKRPRYRHNELQGRGNSQALQTSIGPAPRLPYVLPNSDSRPVPADFPPEDADLLTQFSARHTGFLLSEHIHTPNMRRQAYEYFAKFLRFLRSHSTLDLMTTSKTSVSNDLYVIKMYGFSGEWLDRLVLRLNPHTSHDVSNEGLQTLIKLQPIYFTYVASLEAEGTDLTRRLNENTAKLSNGREAMESISNTLRQIMEERARLNIPFPI